MWWTALIGGFGGLLAGLVSIYEMGLLPKNQRPIRDSLYWISVLLIGPILGGALAGVYQASGMTLKPLVALNVGVTAPLVLRSWLNIRKQPIDPGFGA
ncbi:hypothetical protein LLG46_02905 [bacterium]|nr:hypothetical protein [bacterium]